MCSQYFTTVNNHSWIEHGAIVAHCPPRHLAWAQGGPVFALHVSQKRGVMQSPSVLHVPLNSKEHTLMTPQRLLRHIGMEHAGPLPWIHNAQILFDTVHCWSLLQDLAYTLEPKWLENKRKTRRMDNPN